MISLAIFGWQVVAGFGTAFVVLTGLAYFWPRSHETPKAGSYDFSGLPPTSDVSTRATRVAVVAIGVSVTFIFGIAVLGAFAAVVLTGQREFGLLALALAAIGPLLILSAFVFVRR